MNSYQYISAMSALGHALNPETQEGRRFYVFNDAKVVAEHIAQVKTIADLMQLKQDIKASGTNLTYFREGSDGVFAVDCCAGSHAQRYIFMTKAAYERLGGLTDEERLGIASFTVLEE